MNSLVLLILLSSGVASSAQFTREMLLDPVKGKQFTGTLGLDCYEKLKAFYEEGRLLKSEYIIENSLPLSKFADLDYNMETTRTSITHTAGGFHTFYHYTKSEALYQGMLPEETNRDAAHKQLKDSLYNQIMTFVKAPDRVFSDLNFQAFNGRYFYVSSCPTCSFSFGNIQLSFTFSPKAKVFDMIKAYVRKYDWTPIQSDLRTAYPELAGACSLNKLLPFAFDDSGIDLMRYGARWYQVTNLKNVVASDVLKFPTESYEKADEETELRARHRKYLNNRY